MIPQELREEFDRIAQETEKAIYGPSLSDIPFEIGPLQYAGLGDFRPEPEKITPGCLEFEPTLPTMEIQPVFDLLTGKLIDYQDIPISTLSTDNPALVRPVRDIDDYLQGNSNRKATKLQEKDFSNYLSALETGMNLLTTPFDSTVAEDEVLEPLPDLPEIEPSNVYKAPEESEEQEKVVDYAIHDNWDTKLFNQEVPHPAYEFKFKCDDFQIRSMYRLENKQMVFVSAPTSAGKTVVAQYAIALARQHKMRAIYTSPIKALSNQKFRDLSKEFSDVGILTGDVSLNREASVLIMTTEILRSMLYRDADLLHDVDVVIFDECHYIADDERGVVWEESIILMPPKINMVFLSATIPNDTDIARWIGRTKNATVYVERHTTRPVPLVHSVFAANQVSVLKQPQKNFDSLAYKRVKDKFEGKQSKGKTNNPMFQPSYWQKAIRTFKEKDLLPVLMFSFSIKNCGQFAGFVKNEKLIDDKQSAHVERFFNQAISRLKPQDRQLPQVKQIHDLLLNGIGIHHGGMLPILKECVEILLADGYVKVLFCTSTFAMGINVPARSCAFTSLTKFNGKEVQPLTPTEYVQMSGRAGRRGLDSEGNAILMIMKEFPEEEQLKQLFSGVVENLNSQFYIRFNMILNLVKTQGMEMIDLMKRSLSAHKVQSKLPEKKQKMNSLEEMIKSFTQMDCTIKASIPDASADFVGDIEDIGEVIEQKETGVALNYALIIADMEKQTKSLIHLGADIRRHLKQGQIIFTSNFGGELGIVNETKGSSVSMRMANGANCSTSVDKVLIIFKNKVSGSLNLSQFPSPQSLEIIDYMKEFNVKNIEFHDAYTRLIKGWETILGHPCFTCVSKTEHYGPSISHINTIRQRNTLLGEMDDSNLAFMPTLKSMTSILKEHGYISDEGVIQMKGRVSVEIGSTNEFIATELLTSSFFNDLDPPSIAALSSVLVAQRAGKRKAKGDDEEEPDPLENVPEKFKEKVQFMYEVAENLQMEMEDHQIDIQDDFVYYYVNPAAVMAVYKWAQGEDFIEVMKYAGDILEGQLVRVILMTNELLKSFMTASKLIGYVELSEKFNQAIEAIKRDIIFAASLYFS